MIIRNPYSFIVKYYKIINILLIIPMVYLAFKFGDVATFFKDYIKAGYTTPETNFAESYVTGLTFLSAFIMLIANIILSLVFASKKKNNLYYTINIFYFIFLLFAALLFGSSMSSIEKQSLDATFANFVRDISTISYLPLYLLILINLSKSFGFNYKSLRFDNNAELRIKEDEEEDIEIKIGSDNNTLKKNLVHIFRELRYYILENKFVFTCIGVVLFLIIGYVTYKNYQVYNKVYAINQAFRLDNFTLSLKESYITDTDFRGNIITEGKYYLALRIGLQNNGKEETKIANSHFRIYIGDEVIFPNYDKSARFIDIGEIYQGEAIKAEEEHEYVFVYELNKEQIKNSYQMRILNNLSEKNGKLLSSYRKITVKPRNIIKTQDLGILKLNQEANLKNTTLGNTKYKVKNIKIAMSHPYSYEKCNQENECSTIQDTIVASGGKTLIIIEDEITYDESIPYLKYNDKDFYIDFATLEYQFNVSSGRDAGDKTRTTTLKNVSPKALTDTKVYEVPYTLLNANKINLEIKIRNKYLTIVVKE